MALTTQIVHSPGQWATSDDTYAMMEGAMEEPVNFDPSTLDMSQILGMVSNTVGNTMDM